MKKLLDQIIGQNRRFMKYMIVYSMIFCSAMFLLCYIASWFDVDTGDVLTATCAVFGFDLVSKLIIKVTEEKASKTTGTEKTKEE